MKINYSKFICDRTIIAGAVFVFLLTSQQILNLSGESQFQRALNNSMHTPWFFVVTLSIWELIKSRFWTKKKNSNFILTLITCCFVSLSIAVITELIQGLTARDGSWSDVARDVLGMGTAICFILIKHLQHKVKATGIIFFTLIMVSLLIVGFWSVIHAALYLFDRKSNFPRLVSFENGSSLPMVENNTNIDVVDGLLIWPEYTGKKIGRVRLEDSMWPGITIEEVYPNWVEYKTILIDLYLEGINPIPLVVRLETKNNRGMDSTLDFTLNPGENKLRLPISKLINNEDEYSQVKNLLIFSYETSIGRVIYLGDIRLGKNVNE